MCKKIEFNEKEKQAAHAAQKDERIENQFVARFDSKIAANCFASQ